MSGGRRYRLDWIAERFGLQLRGNGKSEIAGVGTLAGASEHQLTFLANPRYAKQLLQCNAAAVLVRDEHAITGGPALLVTDDPYVAYARIASLFVKQSSTNPGIHPTAVVADSAAISPHASIGPFCVIEPDASVAEGVEIGAHSYIGHDCHLGSQCKLSPRVTLLAGVRLGDRVLVHSGAVIGADGFGLAFDQQQWLKVPQLGGVHIGADCEVGANTCIDRGSIENTVLGNDVRLDNHVQIAHNVIIGDHTAIAGCAAVAGSAQIGRYGRGGGGAGVLGHLQVADHVTITAMSLVTHSIKYAGEYSSGTPLQDNRDWKRNAVRMKHLDNLTRRVVTLEKQRSND